MQAKTFLTAVLGADGFEALNKAAERLPELEAVFVPRTVIAWLDCANRIGFEGEIPGCDWARIRKGELLLGGARHALADNRAAAAMMIALMEDVSIPAELDPKMIARLAKSVETLTKQRFLAMIKALEEASEVSPGEASGSPETTTAAESQSTRETMDGLDKGIEEPGQAAKPRGPAGPTAPKIATKAPATGAGQAKPAQPVGVPKGPGIPEAPATPQAPTQKAQAPQVSRARGFYKSELLKSCPKCNETQMRGRQIVGCLCIADVVSGAELTQKSEGERIVLSGPDFVIVAIEERLGLPPG